MVGFCSFVMFEGNSAFFPSDWHYKSCRYGKSSCKYGRARRCSRCEPSNERKEGEWCGSGRVDGGRTSRYMRLLLVKTCPKLDVSCFLDPVNYGDCRVLSVFRAKKEDLYEKYKVDGNQQCRNHGFHPT